MQDPTMDQTHEPEIITFTHADVLDTEGHKLGTVSDVVSDNRTLQPRWLVVDLGVLKSSHYVPVVGAYRTVDGEIVVPFTKEVVKESPKAHRDHVIDPESEKELFEHYGLAA